MTSVHVRNSIPSKAISEHIFLSMETADTNAAIKTINELIAVSMKFS
jgi:hypothetical protein